MKFLIILPERRQIKFIPVNSQNYHPTLGIVHGQLKQRIRLLRYKIILFLQIQKKSSRFCLLTNLRPLDYLHSRYRSTVYPQFTFFYPVQIEKMEHYFNYVRREHK